MKIDRELFTSRDLDAAGFLSRWTRHRLMRRGEFPRPDAFIGNRPVWRRATLDKYLEAGGVTASPTRQGSR